MLGRALGLFRGNTTSGVPGFYEVTTISIIDEGTIAFMASMADSNIPSLPPFAKNVAYKISEFFACALFDHC